MLRSRAECHLSQYLSNFASNVCFVKEKLTGSTLKKLLLLTLPFLAHQAIAQTPTLTGEVYLQGSPDFYARAQGYQAAGEYAQNQPFAIVYPKNEQDIINAIAFCKAKKVACRPRGGGHGYEAYSSVVRNGVIIDMKHFNSIEFQDANGEKNAIMTAGAGNLMWQLYEALGKRSRNIPLATGPTVGIAGLVTAGGVGITSRRYGTTCEHVVSMRVITGAGDALEINRNHHGDLFAALCGGGGGNAAIITSIKFLTHPIGRSISFEYVYDWKDFVRVVDAYQRFIPYADIGLTGVLALITPDGFGSEPKLKFYGQFTPEFGTEKSLAQQFNQIIKPMEAVPYKKKTAVALKPLWANRVALAFNPLFPGSWEVKKYRKQQLYKSTSSYQRLGEFVSLKKLEELKKLMEAHPTLHAKPSQPSMIQLLSGGLNQEYRALGFYSKGQTQAPSEDLRRVAGLVWQFDGYWTDVQKDQTAVRNWVADLRKLMNQNTSGVYMGYMDSEIKNFLQEAVGPEWSNKMGQLALKYDPQQIFKDPQGWHSFRESQERMCVQTFGDYQ